LFAATITCVDPAAGVAVAVTAIPSALIAPAMSLQIESSVSAAPTSKVHARLAPSERHAWFGAAHRLVGTRAATSSDAARVGHRHRRQARGSVKSV
jgi:hypothetical protein